MYIILMNTHTHIHKSMYLWELNTHLVTGNLVSLVHPTNTSWGPRTWLAVPATGIQKADSPAFPWHPRGEVIMWTSICHTEVCLCLLFWPLRDSLHSVLRMMKGLDWTNFKAVSLNQGLFDPPGDNTQRHLGLLQLVGGDATGIHQVAARDAANRPTMPRIAKALKVRNPD